jgi:NAD-dependent dihydropyrimidine dehydrogenase PreA subunit
VRIDEDRCDGCGLCIPSCHEGALRIVDGKARLVADAACDGLGACLGHCPQGAITIERREALAFDEAGVPVAGTAGPSTTVRPVAGVHPVATDHPVAGVHPPQTVRPPQGAPVEPSAHRFGGCPGARAMQFDRRHPVPPVSTATERSGPPQSELTHWPVQLGLLPPGAPAFRAARLLIAADCVPVAYAGFHEHLLRGRSVAIGCPKFDDVQGYVKRLTEILRQGAIEEILLARMQVPCCQGLVLAALAARDRAGVDVAIREVVISVDGRMLDDHLLPGVDGASAPRPAASCRGTA